MTVAPPLSANVASRIGVWPLLAFFLACWVVQKLGTNVYHAFFGPLSKFPGPKLRAVSILPWLKANWQGIEHEKIVELHKQYGPVVRIAPHMLSVTGDAQTWKDVYGFRQPGQRELVKDTIFYGEPLNRVAGLITADAPTHSRQRKIVSHAFSDKALKEQEPMFRMWAEKLRKRLLLDSADRSKVDLVSRYNFTTFDIMADLTFAEPLHMLDNSEYVPWVKGIFGGVKYGTMLRNFRYFGTTVRAMLRRVLHSIPAVKRRLENHHRYTADRVDRRLAKTPDRPDLWTRILERSNDAGENGLSLQEQYSIASIFMLAGTETTATALSGTTFQLLKNPSYLERLNHDLRGQFNSMEELTLERLARIPFLDACLREGIRVYPPVPIGLPRIIPPGGAVVNGVSIPEGASVSVPQLATYRAEENWKYPFKFRPERWLNDPEFQDDRLDAFEPFSVGPRNCIGKNLAWHEMRLLLATVLLSFDLQLCEESQNWSNQKVYSLWEKHALFCKLTPTQFAS